MEFGWNYNPIKNIFKVDVFFFYSYSLIYTYLHQFPKKKIIFGKHFFSILSQYIFSLILTKTIFFFWQKKSREINLLIY